MGQSGVSRSGQSTSFITNRTTLFGGVAFSNPSHLSCSGQTFLKHRAGDGHGGPLWLSTSTNASWSGGTTLFGNTAAYDGGVYVFQGSAVNWSGRATLTVNRALEDGGGVLSNEFDPLSNPDESTLAIRSISNFMNNARGGNGGLLACFGGLSLSFETTKVTFSGNSADVAGGAVFVSGPGIGPTFCGVRFVVNTVQVGGGLYAIGSGGMELSQIGLERINPTTLGGCTFVGNKATATRIYGECICTRRHDRHGICGQRDGARRGFEARRHYSALPLLL